MEESLHKLTAVDLEEKQVLLSFLLPVYNVRDYLEDCIQSIVQQDLEGIEYEIICIDDNSTDGSYESLLGIANKNKYITVLKNAENKGVSYTRNRLIRAAKGKYIWFIDPDDMLFKNVAKSFLYKAEEVNADILLGNYIRVDETKKGNADYVTDWDMLETYPERKELYLPIDQNGKAMCTVCGGLFLRSFLLENNLWMNEKMIAQEDTLFYYEFSLKTKNIYKWEVPCYLYRQRKSSVMNTHSEERNKKYYMSMYYLWKAYKHFLEEGNIAHDTTLIYKVTRMEENVALCLAILKDDDFIKKEIKRLKNEELYIYVAAKRGLKKEGPCILRKTAWLLSRKNIFWLYHFLTTRKNKN